VTDLGGEKKETFKKNWLGKKSRPEKTKNGRLMLDEPKSQEETSYEKLGIPSIEPEKGHALRSGNPLGFRKGKWRGRREERKRGREQESEERRGGGDMEGWGVGEGGEGGKRGKRGREGDGVEEGEEMKKG